MATCTGICPQSSSWRRCFCGKNVIVLMSFTGLFLIISAPNKQLSNQLQVLEGQRVVPARAKELGFPFKYRYVKDALKAIMS